MTNKKEKFDPLVSIIIPVYNGENYVSQAIDSALAQTYKNIEIIVVNDGSKDKTDEICKSYGNKIRYFKKENGGVSSALNFGIKEMKGEYFSWLSHDDLYLPNKIEYQITFLTNNNYCKQNIILYSDYLVINEKNDIIGLGKKDHDFLEEKREYALLSGSVNGITMLIPKKAFTECGLFDLNLKCTQDYDLWMKMQEKYIFVHIPNYLSLTRVHALQDTKINPLVITEGNDLWIKLIENVPDARKEELQGSIYMFYQNILAFLNSTPYEKTKRYVEKQIIKIEKKVKKDMKSSNYKVSVIIPFYNREKLTIRAIKSVLNQTYKNTEIILVDDCSTKNNELLKKFISDKSNIKYYKTKHNRGPAGARNLGIEKSKGNYIAFLDSDDEFLPNKIEYQLYQMLLNKAKASYTNYIAVQKQTKKEMISFTSNDNNYNEFYCDCKIATPTIMFEKGFIDDNNLKYNENIDVIEDILFYLDVIKHTEFLYIPDFLSNVHVLGNSTVNNYVKQKKGIKNILKYIYDNNEFNMKKELESLYRSYIYFNDLITKKQNKTTIMRYIFRKLVPLNLRKRLKLMIESEKNENY